MGDDAPKSLGDLLAKLPAVKEAAKRAKPPTRVQRRLVEAAASIEETDEHGLCYQHTVFCQTGLPYRDPGATVREWQREQGAASLLIEAGKAKDPLSGKWVNLGLPWGQNPD